jgi:hypothetical protein
MRQEFHFDIVCKSSTAYGFWAMGIEQMEDGMEWNGMEWNEVMEGRV